MKATQEMVNASVRESLAIANEGGHSTLTVGEMHQRMINSALAVAPQQELDPSHAALVAQVERLRASVRQLVIDVYGFGAWDFKDVYLAEHYGLQPGDLGEGGA